MSANSASAGYGSSSMQQQAEEQRPLVVNNSSSDHQQQQQQQQSPAWGGVGGGVPIVSSFESYGDMEGVFMMGVNDIPTKLSRWGFTTGLLYCLIIVCGFGAELGVRGRYIDYDDPRETAQLIRDNPGSFRRGLLLDVVMCTADIFVSLLLTMILVVAGANPVLSVASSLFRFFQQAVIATNLLHMFAASLLLDESLHPTLPVASVISSMSTSSTDDVAGKWTFFFLYMHKYGYLLALYFFGISMLLLGIVIVRHGVFPRWMGWAIALAGGGYILDTLLYFMVGDYTGQASPILMLPVLVAEFSLAYFLVMDTPRMATS